MSRPVAWITWLLLAGFFGCFFVWPIATTVRGAFVNADGQLTFEFVAEVFRNRIYLEGLRNAFWLAVASTVATLIIALPLAWIADRILFPGKKWLSALLLVPMILPPFVGAIGVRQILGQYGALNALLQQTGLLAEDATIDWLGHGRFWGIVALNALHLYPILFLNLTAALANVDPAMEEAAENLGCTGLRKFRKITLPLIMPGLFAGGTIVFIFAFTELGVPLIFDYSRVTSVQIFYGIKEIAGNPFPFALVVVMLVATVLLYTISKIVFGRTSYAMAAKATTAGGARSVGTPARWLCTGLFVAVTLIALLPHFGVICVSFAGEWYKTILPDKWTLEHYETALGHYLTVPSIINSLKYASLSTLIDVVLGVAIAYVVVRTTLPGRHLLDALAMLPLAVPGLVIAFGYISMTQEARLADFAHAVLSPIAWLGSLARFPSWITAAAAAEREFTAFLGYWLNTSRDPTLLLVAAYAVRRLPYVVRSAAAGLQQTSVTLEEAAQNLGCPPFRALRRITLPLIAANVLAGALLAFSFAVLEVSDSLILAQKQQHFPITKAIYELFQLLGEGRFVASALGVWAMLFLAVAIIGTSRILGRKLGALFRI